MNIIKVSSSTITVINLEVNGAILTLDREAAIKLAVELAFLADGNLTTGHSNISGLCEISGWNLDSRFFKTYAKQVTG